MCVPSLTCETGLTLANAQCRRADVWQCGRTCTPGPVRTHLGRGVRRRRGLATSPRSSAHILSCHARVWALWCKENGSSPENTTSLSERRVMSLGLEELKVGDLLLQTQKEFRGGLFCLQTEREKKNSGPATSRLLRFRENCLNPSKKTNFCQGRHMGFSFKR